MREIAANANPRKEYAHRATIHSPIACTRSMELRGPTLPCCSEGCAHDFRFPRNISSALARPPRLAALPTLPPSASTRDLQVVPDSAELDALLLARPGSAA